MVLHVSTNRCILFAAVLLLIALVISTTLLATSVDNAEVNGMGHIIITTLRQESDFVVEWINYNRWIGFDHVVIYDQDDDQTLLPALLRAFVEKGFVTIVPWTLIGDQPGSIAHGLRTFGKLATSVTLMDGDEFLVLCEHISVEQAYRAAGLFDTRHGCLQILWVRFGLSGAAHKPAPNTGILETITQRARLPFTRHAGKVVLRGGYSFLFTQVYGKPYNLPLWHKCDDRREFDARTLSPNVVRLNHYMFRYGLDSFDKRATRGTSRNFKGQGMFKNKTLSENMDAFPWLRNSTTDRHLTNVGVEFAGLLDAVPSSARKTSATGCDMFVKM